MNKFYVVVHDYIKDFYGEQILDHSTLVGIFSYDEEGLKQAELLAEHEGSKNIRIEEKVLITNL
nr:MAG TPA: hypothetical protein [Caudoviricetes sp.]